MGNRIGNFHLDGIAPVCRNHRGLLPAGQIAGLESIQNVAGG
jgi:hypothetical protein